MGDEILGPVLATVAEDRVVVLREFADHAVDRGIEPAPGPNVVGAGLRTLQRIQTIGFNLLLGRPFEIIEAESWEIQRD
jgi:hypothetical protein